MYSSRARSAKESLRPRVRKSCARYSLHARGVEQPGGQQLEQRAAPGRRGCGPSPVSAVQHGVREHARRARGALQQVAEAEAEQRARPRRRTARPRARDHLVVHLHGGDAVRQQRGHEGAAADAHVEVEVEDAAVEQVLERAQAADLVDGAGDAAARADQRHPAPPAAAARRVRPAQGPSREKTAAPSREAPPPQSTSARGPRGRRAQDRLAPARPPCGRLARPCARARRKPSILRDSSSTLRVSSRHLLAARDVEARPARCCIGLVRLAREHGALLLHPRLAALAAPVSRPLHAPAAARCSRRDAQLAEHAPCRVLARSPLFFTSCFHCFSTSASAVVSDFSAACQRSAQRPRPAVARALRRGLADGLLLRGIVRLSLCAVRLWRRCVHDFLRAARGFLRGLAAGGASTCSNATSFSSSVAQRCLRAAPCRAARTGRATGPRGRAGRPRPGAARSPRSPGARPAPRRASGGPWR